VGGRYCFGGSAYLISFPIISRFSNGIQTFKLERSKTIVPEVKKFLNLAWLYNTSKVTNFLFGPSPKLLYILNYKICNQFKFEIAQILKGFKPFGKNLINSPKVFLDMIINTLNLY
jgi:hypothetical protein